MKNLILSQEYGPETLLGRLYAKSYIYVNLEDYAVRTIEGTHSLVIYDIFVDGYIHQVFQQVCPDTYLKYSYLFQHSYVFLKFQIVTLCVYTIRFSGIQLFQTNECKMYNMRKVQLLPQLLSIGLRKGNPLNDRLKDA